MTEIELVPEIFTADYVGVPGERAFYLQLRGAFGTRSYELEKQQVSALADGLRELLVLVDAADTVNQTEPGRDPALALEPPDVVEWRIGTIGLAYDETSDRVLVLAQPVELAAEAAEPAEPEQETEAHRFLLRRDQVRSFVLHTLAIVAEGRPVCQLCGLPIDPEGHNCPASNGHRPAG